MKNLSNLITTLTLTIFLVISVQSKIEAQSKKFYVKPSFTIINLAEESTADIGGLSFENTFSLSNSKTLGISLGYNFLPKTYLDIVIGIPPSLEITGKNEFEGTTIGSILYAPMIMSIDHRIIRLGRLSSIIGAGINYTYILKETDNTIEELNVNNFLAPLIKLGLDFRISNSISLSITANKIIKGSTSVTGKLSEGIPGLGGAPVKSDIQLNPTAVQLGFTYGL